MHGKLLHAVNRAAKAPGPERTCHVRRTPDPSSGITVAPVLQGWSAWMTPALLFEVRWPAVHAAAAVAETQCVACRWLPH